MNVWDKVTGNDMNRAYKAFETRAEKLPPAHQKAWDELKTRLWPHSDITGRNLLPVFDGILGLLEETAADGQSIEEVFGGDINGFCSALAGQEGAKTVRDKWRAQLNNTIAKKLGSQGGHHEHTGHH